MNPLDLISMFVGKAILFTLACALLTWFVARVVIAFITTFTTE